MKEPMNDKFILARRRPAPPLDRRKMLSVRESTYNIIAAWAEETQMSMTDLVHCAIEFANNHVVFVNEDER